MISIDPKKNIGIIFQARSGSSVLQYYLAQVLDAINLQEIFNCYIPNDVVNAALSRVLNSSVCPAYDVNTTPDLLERLPIINRINQIGKSCVFKLYIESYFKTSPEFSDLIKNKNTQFIILDRADFLYSFISLFISQEEDSFHTVGNRAKDRVPKHKKYEINKKILTDYLKLYIVQRRHIDEYFPGIPTLYYEQFQMSPTKICSLFTGIPKRLISIPLSKFSGNHKDHIENLIELEDIYEQFVNEHSDYFPQYFGKLPRIVIPESQGRQPRDLSKLVI